jgi:hypothetical protein
MFISYRESPNGRRGSDSAETGTERLATAAIAGGDMAILLSRTAHNIGYDMKGLNS